MEIAFGGRAPCKPPNVKFKIRENSYLHFKKFWKYTDIDEGRIDKCVNFQDKIS